MATGFSQSASGSDNNVAKTAAGGGTGNGSGMGSGSGIGDGKGSAKTDAPKVQTTPLKILSKPRPSYTEYARFYQISGVIRLRITFSSDGTIGAVVPASKLPFGLTEQAVAASKQIRFEPATRDGQPQTVTRTVEYSFSIF